MHAAADMDHPISTGNVFFAYTGECLPVVVEGGEHVEAVPEDLRLSPPVTKPVQMGAILCRGKRR